METTEQSAELLSAAEEQRLEAVARYNILDSPPDGAFERITALAARLFGVPIAIVSIVDRDRIWLASHHGTEVTQLDRDPGLCASAIMQYEPWLVTDASIDPRTLANPLVAGDFGLRFYVGVPLTTQEGHNLGVLCVIGKEPREVSEMEVTSLKDLATVVMDELELRLAAQRAVTSEAELRLAAEEKYQAVAARHSVYETAARDRQERLVRIKEVLWRGGPTMLFQPITRLDTGRVVGVESLATFGGADAPPPDVWFADAADVGLGTELELVAIRSALAQMHDLPDDAYLSVNASPATISSPELAALLATVPPHRVIVEVTEHAVVSDYEQLSQDLEPIRRMGVRVAVDDAGAGYASLTHILNLRPDVIKIDKELTRGAHNDPARRALASALLTFGSDIGAVIVAEGIETRSQLHALCDLGIQFGQGYYLGRPATLPLTHVSSGQLPTQTQKIRGVAS